MDGDPRVGQIIQSFLLNTLVQRGVTQLQAKFDAIERETAVTVTDGNGTVIQPLKERWIGLMPARVSLIRREPQQFHGVAGSVAELPCRNTVRQPLSCMRNGRDVGDQPLHSAVHVAHHNGHVLEPERVGRTWVSARHALVGLKGDIVEPFMTQAMMADQGSTLSESESPLQILAIQQ